MDNKGKKFETQCKENWISSIPNSFILRLPDQQNGYYGTSQNICDFIAYKNPIMFLIECKTIKGNTFPLTNLKQYDKLISYKGIDGVKIGVIIWFYDNDKVVWVDITEIEKMKLDGKKSVNIKYLSTKEYKLIDIPSIKKRTFMDSDYSVLLEE